jgi:hypothetical protein
MPSALVKAAGIGKAPRMVRSDIDIKSGLPFAEYAFQYQVLSFLRIGELQICSSGRRQHSPEPLNHGLRQDLLE